MAIQSTIGNLTANAQKFPDKPALVRKVDGEWKPISWKGYLDLVRQVGRAFMSLGLEKGGVVTVLSFNRVEWVAADLGAIAAGAVATGIYQTSTSAQVAYIIQHARSPICVVENDAMLNKLREMRSEIPSLKHVVLLDGAIRADEKDWVMSWNDLLKLAEKTPDSALQARIDAFTDHDLATLIYTSGTTGNPKGVMLSHQNLAWTADSISQVVPRSDSHVILSYLPLSHIAEQMVSLHAAIAMQAEVWFAESFEKLKDALAVARPTVFFGVPRVWEKFESVLLGRFAEAKGVKKSLLAFARKAASEMNEAREKRLAPGPLLSLRYALAHKLVLSKLHGALGFDRAKMLVSGAAPISRSTLEFFRSIDMPIYEVYGQSEGSGPTSLNRPDKHRLGTVGPAIPGVTIKIAPDGEILVKGGNVFMGYYQQPEATAETLVDGWLCSGDIGELDGDGFLRITDRKKDLLITAGGKNVAPQNIEKLLKSIPEVSQAVVLGDRKKFLTALLTVEVTAAEGWCKERSITWTGPGALVQHTEFVAHIQKQIDGVNRNLAQYETVKYFRLIGDDFSVEGGELTPSLKVKRKEVNKKYAKLIEELYAGHD